MTLPVSNLVNVSVSIAQSQAQGRNFGDLLIIGDSNVITGLERIRAYTSLPEVASDFGVNAPEYLAASVYYGQSPMPTDLSIGRWLRTATAAQLQGAILTASQQALNNFTAITNGGFDVTIDGGSPTQVTGLNFSTALNLNGVASILTSALSGAATAVWTGEQFILTDSSTGAGTAASGNLTFSANPAAADTVTVNGVTITLVASSPTGNEVLIGSSAQATATNLNTFLSASSNADLTVLTFSVNGLVLTVSAKQVGVAGNAYTLAAVSTAIAVSGATLSGGVNPSTISFATSPASGQDVSTLLGWTAATALPLVLGYAAESALQAVQVLDNLSNDWYGLMFACSVQPTDSDNLAIAAFIEADPVTRLFGITIQNTNVLSSEVTNDLASELVALAYDQTFFQYSSSNPYVVASIVGRMFTVDFTANNTTINLMWKQEPGIVAEDLTNQQAATLQAKHCNVFVAYNNNTTIIQFGFTAGSLFLDETFGIDWLQNAVQTALFNVPYTVGKVPQTDAGMAMLANAANAVYAQGVTNGFLAPGTWTGPSFGTLVTGQFLKVGYYTYVPAISTQSQSDREARKSVPLQSAVKFAGAVNTISLAITANR